jgi:hypothetical protein
VRRVVVVLAVAAAGLAVAAGAPAPVQAAAAPASVRYLESRQTAGGGFAEPGGQPTPGLTAWAVIGLRAAGVPERDLAAAREYLARTEGQLETASDLALALAARAALGERPQPLVARLRAQSRRDGRIGPTVNSTVWALIALRAAGQPAPRASVRYVVAQQHASGGWPWAPRGAPDSNDTAAAVQALRAAGVRGRVIARGLAYLRRHQRPDGGFELTRGRGSDAQSTAWAVQAFLAAGHAPPRGSLRYLQRLRRADGSVRYSSRYAVTPVWVTAQALAALARRPLPL